MKSMLDSFIEQYFSFIKELYGKASLRFGTLGPCGTSSEQAFNYLKHNIHEHLGEMDFELLLEEHFDQVYDDLRRGAIDYAIVPSAYEGITEFFWDIDFTNSLNFIMPTPEYGLVGRAGYRIGELERPRVASCKAVEQILPFLTDGKLGPSNTEIVPTASTTQAVQALLRGEAELAITNQTSFDRYREEGISFLCRKYRAHIVWSVFALKPAARRQGLEKP